MLLCCHLSYLISPKVENLKKRLKAKVPTSAAAAAATSTSVASEADAGSKTELPSTSEPVVNRLNQSDIVLSNEDFMLVGRGSVNVDHDKAPPKAPPSVPDVDPLLDANSRVDDDLTSYARSREALQSKCERHCNLMQNCLREGTALFIQSVARF